MTIIQTIILGVIQGLTEFLPISSSAHLNLFPWLLKWQSMPDSFDVALHVGTLLAIVVYFFKDWIKLIVGGYKQVVKKEKTIEGKIFWQLVTATIPAGILSLIFFVRLVVKSIILGVTSEYCGTKSTSSNVMPSPIILPILLKSSLSVVF